MYLKAGQKIEYFSKIGKEVIRFRGDGFCFINAVVTCLHNNLKIDFDVFGVIQFIMNQFMSENELYAKYKQGRCT